MIIALIGLSGSGKSTVGRLLAEQLGWSLCDVDALIEEQAGQRIPAIFASEGEAGFRTRESAALRAALSRGPCVVATGAGIVVREENRVLLRERALVVWLDAATDALLTRLRAHAEERPLLAGDDPAARLEAQREARAALYAATAHAPVATEGRTARDVCDEIITLVNLFGGQGAVGEYPHHPPTRHRSVS
jgi:shikimate kinase